MIGYQALNYLIISSFFIFITLSPLSANKSFTCRIFTGTSGPGTASLKDIPILSCFFFWLILYGPFLTRFTFHRRTIEVDSEEGGLGGAGQWWESDPEVFKHWARPGIGVGRKNYGRDRVNYGFQEVDTWNSPTGSLLMLMSPNCITCTTDMISCSSICSSYF